MEAAEKIFELLKRKSMINNESKDGDEIVSEHHNYSLFIIFIFQPQFTGQLDFDDVYFVYPNRPESIILKKFKLTIKPGMFRIFLYFTFSLLYIGQKVALVGMSNGFTDHYSKFYSFT
jgi:ABC-type multidrug transport system fused ATPase/permease subunit